MSCPGCGKLEGEAKSTLTPPPSFENKGGPFGLGCLLNTNTTLTTAHAINVIKVNENTTKTITINPAVIPKFNDISHSPVEDNDKVIKTAIPEKPSLNDFSDNNVISVQPQLNDRVVTKAVKKEPISSKRLNGFSADEKSNKKATKVKSCFALRY